MAISLKVQDDTQLIYIKDSFSREENSALRLSLDKKIQNGRKNFIFELSEFNIKDANSLTLVKDIISFLISRNVSTIVVGVPKKDWQIIDPSSGKKPTKYVNLAEGLASTKEVKEPEPPKKEDLGYAYDDDEEDNKGKEDSSPKERTDEDILGEEVKALLEKYDSNRPVKDYDPFSLKNISQLYSEKPSITEIKVLEQAAREYRNIKKENETTENYCSKIAEEVLSLTYLRKKAINVQETKKRESQIKDDLAKVQRQIDDFNAKIKASEEEAASYETKMKEHQESTQQRLDDAELEIQKQKKKNEKLRSKISGAAIP